MAAAQTHNTRLLLVGNYPPDRQMSMERYAVMLRDGLAARGFEVDLVRPERLIGGGVDDRGVAKWLGYVDKYLVFPWRLRALARRYDQVHICDHSNAMYLPYAGPHASITCHDLIAIDSAGGRYPEHPVGRAGKGLQRWIASNLRRARRVVSVSTKTHEDLRAIGWRGDGRVIGNCLNFDFHPAGDDAVAAAKAKAGLAANEAYLIHVGGNQWYKNRVGVVALYAELLKTPRFAATRLLMVGKPWPHDLSQAVQAHGLADSVIPVFGASDEDIRALYTGAEALLFPSLEEGYGWPVLEAQCCGCVVITSNRPPMTEVAGEAAVLIDPKDPGGAARAIAQAADRFDALRAAGFENARRYDREAIMDAYAAFLTGR